MNGGIEFVTTLKPAAAAPESGKGKSKSRKRSASSSASKPRKRKKEKLVAGASLEEAAEFQAKIEARGIVYMSRVPPYMQPKKVRSLLEPHGAVGRIYLAPEEKRQHEKRVKFGGNKKQNFTEGWVEFERKEDAQASAELLNGRQIGGGGGKRKRSWYSNDIWTLKFLEGFKWRHLTESITAERAEQKQRVAAELSEAKRERTFYLSKVGHSKALRERKGRARGMPALADRGTDDIAPSSAAPSAKGGAPAAESEEQPEALRFFSQRLTAKESSADNVDEALLLSVFSK